MDKKTNFKIIGTSPFYPDVLLYRYRDKAIQYVILLAVGVIFQKEDWIITEKIVFETSQAAQNFIIDFSLESAEKWCCKNGLTYS